MSKQKERRCPTCNEVLERVYSRRMIFRCSIHGLFKAVVRRKRKSNFDPNDSSTWTARCVECGGKMEYYNNKYHCTNCGNVLHV